MNNLRQNIDVKNTLQTTVYITPQMKQSLAMLQMPLQELAQEISGILEENPVLEVTEDDAYGGDGEQAGTEAGEEEKDGEEKDMTDTVTSSEWEEYIGYEPSDDISYRPMDDENEVNFEEFVGAPVTLCDHLLSQLKIFTSDPDFIRVGEYIIGNLGDDGYFRTDRQTACSDLGIDEEYFENVLKVVKSFDPAGIASESLAECVTAQMRDSGCDEQTIALAYSVMENYRSELSSFRYDEIMKALGIDQGELDRVLGLVRKTDPRPGLNFSGGGARFVTPDVYIARRGDGFDIILNESGLPPVRLNTYYMKMLKDESLDAASRQYIRDKVKNAVWVIESLQKRQKAIYKVVKSLTEFQKDFLINGEASLKPLRLKDVADATELHESTVSRVTSGKYAMTDHGIMELKSFFSKSTVTDSGDVSTNTVKNKIRELINREDPESPLSDQDIVEIMTRNGVRIARRTVAKYRDEMNIPTMSQRKRLRR